MRLIDADALFEDICDSINEMTKIGIMVDGEWLWAKLNDALENAPTIKTEPQWIPCSERLPKINQSVLLATSNGVVFIGHRTKPELIWQVTEEDGRKHWVYDPEAYTDDIESLPKGEDCAFDNESQYEDGALSVTSANYNPRFDGVVAWMPLPTYEGVKE